MADIGRDEDLDVVDLSSPGARTPTEADVVELRDEAEEDGLPPQAVLEEGGTILLPLSRPVALKFRAARTEAVRTEEFSELRFHPLTGADMRVIQGAAKDSIMPTAIARSARIHEAKMNAIYDRLDARDATAAQLVVLHFLGSGRPTGR